MNNNMPSLGNRKRKYFSLEERKRLEKMREEGISARSCAKVLGRSHSTILHELWRKPSYDRWSLAHAAVTTTTLNARIAMTPNGQLWRKMTPADLPS